MQIKHSEIFKRAYKARVQKNAELRELFWEALEVFEQDPLHTSLRTHKLTGSLEGKWAFSVTYDCRVVFHMVSDKEIILLDIGSHDEVY